MLAKPIMYLAFTLIALVSVAPEGKAQARERAAERIDRIDRMRDRPSDRARERTQRQRPDERVTIDANPATDRPETERDTQIEEEAVSGDASDTGTLILEDRTERIRRGEILALNLSPDARIFADASGLSVVRQRDLGGGNILYVLRGGSFDDPRGMIAELRNADPEGVFTPNHVYGASADPQEASLPMVPAAQNHAVAAANVRIGMIDGLPDREHPLLENFLTSSRNFLDRDVLASSHGTAIALHLAQTRAEKAPYLDIELFAAVVLSPQDDRWVAADALAGAIAWQEEMQVGVLNISLAGPPNEIIEALVDRFLKSGGKIVAAVGNGGPLSSDIYPAAYHGVVGATAIDANGGIYPLATRGQHVDMAALGVDLKIAGLASEDLRSGTSYAVPFVSIWLAAQESAPEASFTCVDLGAPGRDDIFGCGTASFNMIATPQLAARR